MDFQLELLANHSCVRVIMKYYSSMTQLIGILEVTMLGDASHLWSQIRPVKTWSSTDFREHITWSILKWELSVERFHVDIVTCSTIIYILIPEM